MIIMSYVSTGTRSTNPRNAWVCPVCPDVARRQPPADRRPYVALAPHLARLDHPGNAHHGTRRARCYAALLGFRVFTGPIWVPVNIPSIRAAGHGAAQHGRRDA